MSKVQNIRIDPQYVSDKEGHITSVILSLAEFRALMEIAEDLIDLDAYHEALRTSEGMVDLEEVIERFRQDGLL